MISRLDRLALGPVRSAARSSASLLGNEAERVIDGLLAGPLPEAVARSTAEHQVVQRVVAEFLDAAAATDGSADQLEELLDRVLRSPALERWVASGEAAGLVEPIADRVLRSEAFKQSVMEIMASPQVRKALTSQTVGFGAEVSAATRSRAARGDDALETRVHGWLRIRHTEQRAFAGFGMRGIGLVVDVLLAQIVFLVVEAMLAVLGTLAGISKAGATAWAVTGGAWLLVSALYFTGFWASGGQTPGMRLMGIRVVTRRGNPPSLFRSLVRFVGLLLAIIPLGAGFLPVFVDRRRRALQDFLAGTVVRRDLDELEEPDADSRELETSVEAEPRSAQPSRAPALRSVSTDVGGLRIHATTGGKGPAVVLVHGLGISGTYMLPLARSLATSCSVYVPDLPGEGKSGPSPSPWGIPDMARVLGDWLDTVGVAEPLVVANSMGCQVVTELAVRRPGVLGPLVLIGPTVDPARRSARHKLFDVLRDTVHEPVSVLAIAARNNTSADIRPLLRSVRATLADRIEDRLPLIEQQAVVVYGERDQFVGRAWAERATALLPRGRLVVVPSEPHTVHYTRPDLVARIVRELLIEEGKEGDGELAGSLEHRDVTAAKSYDPRSGQRAVPLLR